MADGKSLAPGLYVVATPLGNPADLTPRARAALESADMVLAEDTRRAGLQFQRWGLREHGRLVSMHDHNEDGRIPQVLGWLAEAKVVALISDAGTPLISDPGYRLVAAVRDAGHRVVPLPGPAAPITALSACGLPPSPHVFLGFLPRKAGDIRKLFSTYGVLPASLVFFERKDRVAKTLELAAEALESHGNRRVCVARELTKEHEEFMLGSLFDRSWLPDDIRGELTVVLSPGEATAGMEREEFLDIVRQEAAAGGKPRHIAKRAAARAPGWSADDAYQALGNLRGQAQDPSGEAAGADGD